MAKKSKSLPVSQKNAAVTDDENIRVTKIDWSKGADEPMTDLARQGANLKMFKQASLMTVEKSGWVHRPVDQMIDEPYSKHAGQEQR